MYLNVFNAKYRESKCIWYVHLKDFLYTSNVSVQPVWEQLYITYRNKEKLELSYYINLNKHVVINCNLRLNICEAYISILCIQIERLNGCSTLSIIVMAIKCLKSSSSSSSSVCSNAVLYVGDQHRNVYLILCYLAKCSLVHKRIFLLE